jgi:hypothetical protein
MFVGLLCNPCESNSDQWWGANGKVGGHYAPQSSIDELEWLCSLGRDQIVMEGEQCKGQQKLQSLSCPRQICG